MAAIVVEGTIYIPLREFWTWLRVPAGSKGVFSIQDDAWIVTEEKPGPVTERFIEAAEFWHWVDDTQLDGNLVGYEKVFGVPRIVEPDIVISFAASSEGTPRNWAAPPKCLSEWKNSA